MTRWKVGTPSPVEGRDMDFHDSHAAYQTADAGSSREAGRKELASTLWSPANAAELGLERWSVFRELVLRNFVDCMT